MPSWGLAPSEFLLLLDCILDSADNGIARGLVLSSVGSLAGLRRGRREILRGVLRGKWRLLRRSLRRINWGGGDIPFVALGGIAYCGVGWVCIGVDL